MNPQEQINLMKITALEAEIKALRDDMAIIQDICFGLRDALNPEDEGPELPPSEIELMNRIVAHTAAISGLSIKAIQGFNRTPRHTRARHAAVIVADRQGLSQRAIGKGINKDRSICPYVKSKYRKAKPGGNVLGLATQIEEALNNNALNTSTSTSQA